MSEGPKPFTGRARERTTRRSVLVMDKLSRAVITVGGIGTIVAVLFILFFLIAVVAPLFGGADVEAAAECDTRGHGGRLETAPRPHRRLRRRLLGAGRRRRAPGPPARHRATSSTSRRSSPPARSRRCPRRCARTPWPRPDGRIGRPRHDRLRDDLPRARSRRTSPRPCERLGEGEIGDLGRRRGPAHARRSAAPPEGEDRPRRSRDGRRRLARSC